MAITRVWQAGAESNTTASESFEFDSLNPAAKITTSAAQQYTGSYSYAFATATGFLEVCYATKAVPSTRQLRVGFWWRAAIAYGGTPPELLSWFSSGGELGSLEITSTGTANLTIATVLQDSLAGAFTSGTWYHVAADIKIDSVAGWVKIYKNGLEILSYTGNTGNADIEYCRFGEFITAGSTSGYATVHYIDDIYIDDLTGEAAAAAAPALRFDYITPNAVGQYSEMTPSAAVDHYTLVDERPKDDDTTYVEGDAVDERESYGMTTVTIPANHQMTALIPVAYAKKGDAGTDSELAFLIRDDATATDVQGAPDIDLSTDYAYWWQRFTTDPNGDPWDQSALDDVEVGYVAEGTY